MLTRRSLLKRLAGAIGVAAAAPLAERAVEVLPAVEVGTALAYGNLANGVNGLRIGANTTSQMTYGYEPSQYLSATTDYGMDWRTPMSFTVQMEPTEYGRALLNSFVSPQRTIALEPATDLA